MEKNQNGPKSVGICKKILSAFTHVFPVFRKVRRSTSSGEQVPKPASSPPPNPKNNEIQTKPPAPEHPKSLHGFQRLEQIEVPVEFDPSSLHSSDVRAKPATVPHFPIQNTSTKPGIINSLQEKPKLKMQNEGQGDKAASEDEEKQKPKLEAPEKTLEGNPGLDINDRSSDFIKHAKMKIIRTGSKVGRGKKATSALQDDDAQDTKKRDQGAKDDLFSEYIDGAKTRIRTTPSMKSGRIVSFNRK